ncbi:MAG: hypothetical protein EXS03_01400 [Phycisphaerales bacterium]|nr:hypothetical protein [Phycisphaerales bacterium]
MPHAPRSITRRPLWRAGFRAALVATAAIAVVLNSSQAQSTRTDHFDGAVSTLQRCVIPTDTREHHALIVSLRALRDPALQPFFEELTRSTNWSSRVDGILGLAELSKTRDIDPHLVERLASAEDRSTAIRNAVGFRLLSPASIRQLLRLPDWPALDLVVLNAELHRQGEKVDEAVLKVTASDPSDEIAALACALLISGDGEESWNAFEARLARRTPEVRNLVLQEMAKAILLYEIEEAVVPMLRLVADDAYTTATRMMANGSALALAPAAGQEAWKRLAQSERAQTALVRAGLQLMSQTKPIEPGLASAIRNGEPLVEAIADAIEANASGDQEALAAALMVVIDRGNRQSAEWAVQRAAALPSVLGVRVWRHLLDRFLTAPDNSLALGAVVVDAARRLALADPPIVESLIRGAAREPQVQEILVLALCDAASPEAAKVARSVRGSFTRRGDSLAILAIARGEPTIDPETLRELGIIGAGGGDLDPTLLVQAAWLFARHSGRADQALARVNPQ